MGQFLGPRLRELRHSREWHPGKDPMTHTRDARVLVRKFPQVDGRREKDPPERVLNYGK